MEYPAGSGTIHSTPQYSQSQQNINSTPHQSAIYNNSATNSRYPPGTGPVTGGTGNGPSSEYINYRHPGYTSGPPQSQSPYNAGQIGVGSDYCSGGSPAVQTRPILYTSTNSGLAPRQIPEMAATHSQSQHHSTPARYDQSSQNWSMPPHQQGFNMSHSSSEQLHAPPNHGHQAFYDNQVYAPLPSGAPYNGSYVSSSGTPAQSLPPHYSVAANNSAGVVGARYNHSLADMSCHPQNQQAPYGNYRPVYQGLDQSVEKTPPQHWILPPNQHNMYNSMAPQQTNQVADVRHQPLTEPVSPEPSSAAALGCGGGASGGGVSSIKVNKPASGDSNSGSGNRQINQPNGVCSNEEERPLSRISEPSTPRPNASTSVGPNSGGVGSNSSTPAPAPPQASSPMPQQASSHQYFGHSQQHPQQQAAPPPYGMASRPPSRNAYAPPGGGKPVYSAVPYNTSQQVGSNAQMTYPHGAPPQPMYQTQQRTSQPPYSGEPSSNYGYFPTNSQGPLAQQPTSHGPFPGSHQAYSYGPPAPPPPPSLSNQGPVSGSHMMGPPPSIDQYRASPCAPSRRPPPSNNTNSTYQMQNNGGLSSFELPSSVSVVNGTTVTTTTATSISSKLGESDLHSDSRRFKNQSGNKPGTPSSINVNMTYSDDSHSNLNQASPCHSSTHDEDSLLSSPMTPATTGTNSGCATPFGTPSSIVNNPAAALLTATGQHKLFIMGDEPERRIWVENYLAFMEEIGRPLTNLPQVAKHPLDLYRLYLAVRERGGVMEVVKTKRWKEISQYVNINASASAAYTLRKNYMKYVVDFECRFDRGGADPRPLIAQIESMSAKKKKSGTSSSGSSSSGGTVGSNTVAVSPSITMSQELAIGAVGSPKCGGIRSSPSPINGIISHPPASGQHPFTTPPGYSHSPSVLAQSQDLVSALPQHNGIAMHRPDVAVPTAYSAPPHQHPWQPQQHSVYSSACQESHVAPQALPGGSLQASHNHMSISAPPPPSQPIAGQYLGAYSSCPPAPAAAAAAFRSVIHSGYENVSKDASMPANHQIRQLQQLVHNQVPLPVTATPSMSSDICAASPLIAGQLQQRPAAIISSASQLHHSSALIGMLTSGERFGPPVRPDWPGYVPPRSLSHPCPPNSTRVGMPISLEHNAGVMSGLRPHFNQHLRNAPLHPHDLGMPPTMPHHLHNVHSLEAQMRNRFDAPSTLSPYHHQQQQHQQQLQHQHQLALHHQLQQQNMGAPGVMMPHRMIGQHSMSMFDPKTVEGIQIFDVKRFRLTPKDIGPIDPWRMYMGLKSGLACEGSRALDTLNVVLADADALSYMSLFRLPGFLETLVELWRRSLMELFPQARFDELELAVSTDVDEKNEDSCTAPHTHHNHQPIVEDVEYDLKDDDEYDLLRRRVRRARCTAEDFTFRSRCGKRVKLELRKGKRRASLQFGKAEYFCSGTHVWKQGQGDTTRHVVSYVKRKRLSSSFVGEEAATCAKKSCRKPTVDLEANCELSNDGDTDEVLWRPEELNQRVLNLRPDEESGQLLGRCVVLSNVLRSLSFLSANETELCAHAGLLRLIGHLLLFLSRSSPLVGGGVSLREDALVLLTNVAGQLSLESMPDAVIRPLLEALLACLCEHAPWEATHRLALECLARLSVREVNVDLILATRPWKRLMRLMDLLCQHLLPSENSNQVTRELALSTLSYLVRDGSGATALYVAHANSMLIPLLFEFIEATETAAIRVAQTQGIGALREQPELMGTSLDMLRRAASILHTLAQLPENAALLRGHQARLLLLVMSQILDQQVASMLAEVLFLVSKDDHLSRAECRPLLQIKREDDSTDVSPTLAAAALKVKEEISPPLSLA